MKTKLFLIISFLFYFNSNGQISFGKHSIIGLSSSVEKPLSSYPADIDGDGDMDIITSSYGFGGTGYKVSWHENLNGKGDFGTANTIIAESIKLSVYIIDMDGDGDLDMLYSSNSSITWIENSDGKGNFNTKHPIIRVFFDPITSFYPEDADNDGDLDIFYSVDDYPNNYIKWIENTDGKGLFNDSIDSSPYKLNTITNLGEIRSIYALDMDGDNDIDLAASIIGSDAKTVWYENIDGKGAFESSQVVLTNVYGLPLIYNMDVDNDGYLDIVSKTSNKIVWHKNIDGKGNFDSQQIIADNISTLISMHIVDVNGDGALDILINNNNKISWYEHLDEKGTFSSEKNISTNDLNTTSISLTDIDGDSDLDIIRTGYGVSDEISWYENKDGLGDFQFVKNINGDVPNLLWILKTADIDGDEDMDMILNENGKLSWYENKNGIGDYNKLGNYIANVDKIEIIDMDSDGDNDILLGGEWIENDGYGNFNTEKKIIINNFKNDKNWHFLLADIDNDGDKDILGSDETNTSFISLLWYENLGDYSFASPKVIGTNIYGCLSSPISEDVDDDGDNDIIIAHYDISKSSNLVSWYENLDGKGNFSTIKKLIGGETTNINFVDLDNDNDLDLLFTLNNIENRIAWAENIDGKGSFGLANILSGYYNGYASSHPVDMDKDGLKDIVYGGTDSSIVYWKKNMGYGQFSGANQVTTDLWYLSNPGNADLIHISDLDNDDDEDVIVYSSDKFELTWYENSKNQPIKHNKISGEVNLDVDINGCDINDLSMPRLKIVTINGNKSLATFTQKDGAYELFTDIGDYTTSISSALPNYYTSSPISKISNFTNVGNNEIIDFCVEPNQTINDLNITILPIRQARPGFNSSYQLVIHNVGTTQLSGNAILTFDNTKLNYLNASESPSSQTTSTLTFDYSNLRAYESRTIDLTFKALAPPTTNIGDILNFTASINPVSGDNTESDNTFTYNETVIGSYDPNDITVLEGNQILLEDTGKYLHYIIRFQNTGTADAINVKVDNVLDSKLDWTTLQLVSSSHTNRVEIKDGKEVSFIFNGIYLPDSTSDEPNSHGFIAYKIKPKNGIAIGDIMPNQAGIFFDFNPAIITNTVTTEITSSLSVDENLISKFYIYPNPTKNVLNIQSKTQITKLEVYNNIGQIVSSKLNKTTIDVSTLSAGLYFIKITDDITNSETKKFIKE